MGLLLSPELTPHREWEINLSLATKIPLPELPYVFDLRSLTELYLFYQKWGTYGQDAPLSIKKD